MDIYDWLQSLLPDDALSASLLAMCGAAVIGLIAYYWHSPWARPGRRKIYFEG